MFRHTSCAHANGAAGTGIGLLLVGIGIGLLLMGIGLLLVGIGIGLLFVECESSEGFGDLCLLSEKGDILVNIRRTAREC